MLSSVLGLVLLLSGLGVLAALRLVRDPRQRAVLRAVALFDVVSGAAVLALGVGGILP